MAPTNPNAQQPQPGETVSALTLADYIGLLEHYRRWFVLGLLLSMAATFAVTKFVSLKFFRAEAMFYINNRMPIDQIVGITDVKLFETSRNDTFQAAVQMELADRLLRSTEMLTSATQALQTGPGKYNLYQLLRIDEKNPQRRQSILFTTLRKNLISVRPVETTGLMEYSVELPDAVAAAQFANISLELMQRKYAELTFGYFIKARELYEEELAKSQKRQEALAGELKEFDKKHAYDAIASIRQQKNEMEERLKAMTGENTKMAIHVENLRLATSPEALKAAQPIKVIQQAEIPLKKSRPQTILTTLIAGALYTFVFLTGLMLVGMWRAVRAAGKRI
jgi:uncharacterized protein involved in exopolysaccharide biosynthesis